MDPSMMTAQQGTTYRTYQSHAKPSLWSKMTTAYREYRIERGSTVRAKSTRGIRTTIDTIGLACLATAAGMVAVPLGIAAAGVALFIFSWRIGGE